MAKTRRAFVFGAGFSYPAGLPLATELLPLIERRMKSDDARAWLERMQKRLDWLENASAAAGDFRVNIEQVFHFAHFDAETHRLLQHRMSVGRQDGPGTHWSAAESIEHWLARMEEDLCDVIEERQQDANLAPVLRWANCVVDGDCVITFNYDTLVENSLTQVGKTWSHGLPEEAAGGIPVLKMHGSIDWILADRRVDDSKLDLLFEKQNSNRNNDEPTGNAEEDLRLWRCRSGEQRKSWLSGRDVQMVPQGGYPARPGIAGLGAYKELHKIPGLGHVWKKAMEAMFDAELVVIVGFSLSDFDAMAQLHFADVAKARFENEHPLNVLVIDPFIDSSGGLSRFHRVFRKVAPIAEYHEKFGWNRLNPDLAKDRSPNN